ncbi:MAG: hypothetical protein HQ546_05360 [Planctomycetes bacterium]|nr:hypothetical protein [Planctomycetota bacterium]
MTQSATKPRFPRADACAVAAELVKALRPDTARIIIAGSLRRRKDEVGDVEILYISRIATRTVPGELFAKERGPAADQVIEQLERAGILARRLNGKGTQTYGPKNKLMVHCASGIPVDLFAATQGNWWNYLVCRTGGKQNNIAICQAARGRRLTWNPYGPGFSNGSLVIPASCEREVYDIAGLPYREPWERQ